jgi:hypothetical protein
MSWLKAYPQMLSADRPQVTARRIFSPRGPMQSLPPALFIVMLELTVGAFVTLYLLDLRGGCTRGFMLFQGVLYAVFAFLTWGALQAFASQALLCQVGLCRADLDPRWLSLQAPFVIGFTVLLVAWNIVLWRSPAPAKKGNRRIAQSAPPHTEPGKSADDSLGSVAVAAPAAGTRIVLMRHIVGALTSLAGLSAVVVVGMAYRPLANAHLGGTFVVAAFLAGTLAIGGVTTAMLLGHWYLNTPTASGKPLEFVTVLLVAGLLTELVFALLIGPSTAHQLPGAVTLVPGTTIHTSGTGVVVTTPTPVHTPPGQPSTTATHKVAPIDTSAMVWLQFTMGNISPLILGVVALWLTRGRSFQSATGMLYLCMAFIFIGEILARGLMLLPVL